FTAVETNQSNVLRADMWMEHLQIRNGKSGIKELKFESMNIPQHALIAPLMSGVSGDAPRMIIGKNSLSAHPETYTFSRCIIMS
ncbi:MAG: hypothetical protein V3U69_06465, partial [Bacteroidota bacterium]